jgi:hypothetical protein
MGGDHDHSRFFPEYPRYPCEACTPEQHSAFFPEQQQLSDHDMLLKLYTDVGWIRTNMEKNAEAQETVYNKFNTRIIKLEVFKTQALVVAGIFILIVVPLFLAFTQHWFGF